MIINSAFDFPFRHFGKQVLYWQLLIQLHDFLFLHFVASSLLAIINSAADFLFFILKASSVLAANSAARFSFFFLHFESKFGIGQFSCTIFFSLF
jgi:hypothetical protein